jgi:hypothetical protein
MQIKCLTCADEYDSYSPFYANIRLYLCGTIYSFISTVPSVLRIFSVILMVGLFKLLHAKENPPLLFPSLQD